jgi:hypothetical protein
VQRLDFAYIKSVQLFKLMTPFKKNFHVRIPHLLPKKQFPILTEMFHGHRSSEFCPNAQSSSTVKQCGGLQDTSYALHHRFISTYFID